MYSELTGRWLSHRTPRFFPTGAGAEKCDSDVNESAADPVFFGTVSENQLALLQFIAEAAMAISDKYT